MNIFCLHWASAVTYVVSQLVMSVMVINCWSSKTRAGPVIYVLKFVELTSINLWAISSMAISLLIASIVQAFSKMRRVPRVIGSSRVIWSCVFVAMGLTLLSAPFWNDVLVTGSYFWITNRNDPNLARWISLSFVTTQGIAGALMALTLVFVATGKRRKSLLVCIRTSKRMKLCETFFSHQEDDLKHEFVHLNTYLV
ncbi:hypothetical protein Esi_0273_0022 [Ectocarpus siliculosus]|uniref:Uncharacterized protein n=1 Tax=Ectocarpus siliculosus TaxID=2880 RepID=D7FUL8_ECTSI|nr:hypothetical protein Esi_0273_0022 [Ectocarpus siliculosus]|eukprot:CBJ31674.1 hypothetical protein Esi_0273_0022 [Ectocarpus siliculosus]